MPPPPEADWLPGAFDLHVHAGPSFFPRWGGAGEVVAAARSAGMAGVVLKAHEGSTVAVAAELDARSDDLAVYGGVVLNRYVGGIEPAAAEAALRLGGRCVWLPTIDAQDHVRAYGATGAYDRQAGGRQDAEGLRVVGVDGRPTAAVLEVLALVAEYDACLATGHISAAEIAELLPAARAAGIGRVLLQHPCARTPALDGEAIGAAVRAGAHVELTWLGLVWEESTIDRYAQVMRAVGSVVVLSSDAGQRTSPPPPAALADLGDRLVAAGAPAQAVRRSLTELPAALVAP